MPTGGFNHRYMETAMKYNGQTIALETREIELPRTTGSIRLRISAVSVGVRRDFEALYPKPNPPTIVVETKAGRKTETNWEDPKWRKEVEEREYLQNIYIVYRVLAGDPNVQFENNASTVDGLKAVAKEFCESGLSEGDILLILKEALRASNLSQEEITAAKAGF